MTGKGQGPGPPGSRCQPQPGAQPGPGQGGQNSLGSTPPSVPRPRHDQGQSPAHRGQEAALLVLNLKGWVPSPAVSKSPPQTHHTLNSGQELPPPPGEIPPPPAKKPLLLLTQKVESNPVSLKGVWEFKHCFTVYCTDLPGVTLLHLENEKSRKRMSKQDSKVSMR